MCVCVCVCVCAVHFKGPFGYFQFLLGASRLFRVFKFVVALVAAVGCLGSFWWLLGLWG